MHLAKVRVRVGVRVRVSGQGEWSGVRARVGVRVRVHLGKLIAVDEERAGADLLRVRVRVRARVRVRVRRAGADRVERGGEALGPILLDDGVLAGVGVHVAEDEGGGGLGRREVGDRLHDDLGRVRVGVRARARVRGRVRVRAGARVRARVRVRVGDRLDDDVVRLEQQQVLGRALLGVGVEGWG